MKKFFTLGFLGLCLAFSAVGQYYYVPYTGFNNNPYGLNTDDEYPVGGGLSATWSTVLTGGQPVGTYSTTQTVPFPFMFNGSSATQYKVSNSGVLTFTVASPATVDTIPFALPSALIPDKSVVIWGINGANSTSDVIAKKTFGVAPHRQHWVFFTSYSKGLGTNFTYWSIVLEEGTNNIYIVDQRHNPTVTGLTLGVQVNATTATQVTGSPNASSLAGSNAAPADNAYYRFVPGASQPGLDMVGLSVNLSPYVYLASAPVTIGGVLRNEGTTTVTSFTLNYSDGGATVSSNVTGVNIPALSTYNFSHPTGWTPSGAGDFTMKVWASNINGSADQNMSNDTALVKLQVIDEWTPRVSLLEVFTSSSCAPCKPGNENMDTILGTNPLAGVYANKFTVVKYQQNFPGNGDPYCTDEAVNRRAYYAINSIPRLEIDGQWDGNAGSLTGSIFQTYNQEPAFMGIVPKMTVTGQTCNITIDIYPIEDNSTSGLRLYTAIVEKYTDNNIATNGEVEFHYVMKKMLPDVNGKLIGTFTKGVPKFETMSYTFNGAYRLPPNGLSANRINHATEHSVEEFSDLSVVAWVQDPATKKVLQSSMPGIVSYMPEQTAFHGFTVYPNPASEQITLMFELQDQTGIASAEIINLLGERVATADFGSTTSGIYQKSFDTSNLSPGVYMVRLSVDGASETKKIIIQ